MCDVRLLNQTHSHITWLNLLNSLFQDPLSTTETLSFLNKALYSPLDDIWEPYAICKLYL